MVPVGFGHRVFGSEPLPVAEERASAGVGDAGLIAGLAVATVAVAGLFALVCECFEMRGHALAQRFEVIAAFKY